MSTKSLNKNIVTKNGTGTLSDVSAGANVILESFPPYCVAVEIVGVADLLFNRFNEEEYTVKREARKGSKEKSLDVPDNRVYRDREGLVCLPGLYLCNSLVAAAKFYQDPRSSRKSAMDLFKAGVFPETDYSPIVSVTGETSSDGWDYLDKRGACVNRSRIVRARPAFFKGWSATVNLMVQAPEYINPDWLHEILAYAGRMVGVGDFRPTFGRFRISRFEVLGD